VLLTPEFGASRDEALAALAAAGVSARRGIMAAHLEPAYEGHPYRELTNTERLTRDSLILPLHHAVTEDDQRYIVDILRGLRRA
jgi:perosamine synthetase